MQMLYNSDSYVVVQFDVPQSDTAPRRGGYEIVDKFARKEIYLQGALADSFQRGVQAVVEAGPDEEAMDDFIAGWTTLAQQPLASH
jgi:hypothetical protein